MFLDHTQRRSTVGTTPLEEWSARRRDLYLTTHNTHNRQTSMPPVGFEPTISAGERPQTYALDRADTGTSNSASYERKIHEKTTCGVIHSVIQLLSALRQVHSLFQRQLSTEYEKNLISHKSAAICNFLSPPWSFLYNKNFSCNASQFHYNLTFTSNRNI